MKRVFSLLLVLLLVVGLVPVQARANGQPNLYISYDCACAGHDNSYSYLAPGTTGAIPIPEDHSISYVKDATTYDPSAYVNSNGWTVTMPADAAYLALMVGLTPNNNGGGSDQMCNVSVSPYLENGTFTVDMDQGVAGDVITITPVPDQDYKLSYIVIYHSDSDGLEFQATPLPNGKYTFTLNGYNITIGGGFVFDDGGSDNGGETGGGTGGGETGGGTGGGETGGGTGGGAPHRVTDVITADHADPVIANNSSKTIEAMAGTTITIDPRPNEGYEFVRIKLEYADGTGEWLADGVLSFEMPDIDLYVAVYYKECDTGNTDREYPVSVYTDKNGQATPSKTSAKPGEEITVTCTPNTGYSLGTINSYANTASGMLDLSYQLTGNNQFTFNMPNAEAYIVVYFSEGNGGSNPPQLTVYDITVETDGNGTLISSELEAEEGDYITVAATPNTGYELDKIIATDGTNTSDITQDQAFYMPASDVTVRATFKDIDNGGQVYNVTVNPADNGTVSANPTQAQAGTPITVTTAPADGYELDTLTVKDGNNNAVTVTDGKFNMPQSDVTVTATFKRAENADDDETTHAIHLHYETNQVAVTASATEAKAGETVTITTTPKKFSGGQSGGQWAVSKIMLYKYGDYSVKQEIPLLTKSFTMPDYDVIVSVICEVAQPRKITYQVVKGVAKKTSISASGNLIQLENGVFGAKESLEITIGATPADGYALEYINVYKADTDELYVSTKDGKFSMPNFDVRVDIAFESTDSSDPADPGNHPTDPSDPTEPQETMYNITVIKPVNGTVAAPEKAKKGDSVTVITEPDEGFVLDQITVIDGNGQPVTVTNGKFTMPESGVTVTVTFKAIEYSVSVTTPENGTLSANPTKAQKDGTVTVTATPAEGYKLIRVTVTDGNGNEIILGADNTFAMPGSDVTVAATFALDQKIQVSFDPNSGSCGTPSSELDPGSSLDNIPSAGREGYLFLGWYTEDGTPVTDGTVFTESTTVHARWAAHTTHLQGNDFGADIAIDDDLEILKMLVTDEELKSGLDVVVYMTVDEKSPSAVPTADYNAINSVAGTDRIGAYLDIQLFKQIGNDTPVNIHNTKDNLVPITVQLPDTVIPQNAVRDSFYIIYHHVEDGETITSTVPAAFDVASKTLSFSASRFSTYALAYTTYDVRFDADGGAGTMETQHIPAGNFTLPTCTFTAPSGKEFAGWKIGSAVKKPGDQITLNTDITITAIWQSKTSSGTLDSVPKTGDTSGLAMWTLLILCSTAMLAGVAVCDKRRAR